MEVAKERERGREMERERWRERERWSDRERGRGGGREKERELVQVTLESSGDKVLDESGDRGWHLHLIRVAR